MISLVRQSVYSTRCSDRRCRLWDRSDSSTRGSSPPSSPTTVSLRLPPHRLLTSCTEPPSALLSLSAIHDSLPSSHANGIYSSDTPDLILKKKRLQGYSPSDHDSSLRRLWPTQEIDPREICPNSDMMPRNTRRTRTNENNTNEEAL